MLKIKLSARQYLFLFIWLTIFLISLFLLLSSLHFIPSLILFIINASICLYGFIYSMKIKNILFFSPILQTSYCALFYCGLIGLYYFSKYNFIDFFKLPTQNELLMINIALVYFIFIFSLFFPYFLSLLFKKKPKLNFSFFQLNFSKRKVHIFFIISQILLIFLLIIIFATTKYTPISALSNPLGFKYEYTHGISTYFFVLFDFLLKLHLCLILKYIFIDKEQNINKNLYIISFLIFYLYWSILSGGRSNFIFIFVSTVYFFSFSKKYKINLKNILIMLMAGLITITITTVYYVFINYQASLQKGKLNTSTEINILYTSLERIDNFSNSVRFFKYIDDKKDGIWSYSDFQYKKQFLSQISTLIPRSILKDKGYPISGELTRIIFPHVFGKINFIFGGLVNLYYTGGIFFVIIDALLFGIFIMLLQVNFLRLIKYDFFITNYIFIFLNIPISYFAQGFYNSSALYTLIINIIISLSLTYTLTTKKIKIHYASK